MHHLLKCQLKSIYGKSFALTDFSKQESLLIERISSTYAAHDKDRLQLEHVLKMTSEELMEKNRSSENILHLFSEAQRLAHIGSWFLEFQNPQLQCSDELYQIFGLVKESSNPPMSLFYDVIHPEDRAFADTELVKTFHEGSFDAVYRLQLDSGEIKFVHEYREVKFDLRNNPVAVQGSIQDVTQQKKSEQKLNLYASVFHNSGECLLITDKNNKIIAVNSAFTNFTKYLPDEVIGKDPGILSNGETPGHIYKKMWLDLKEHDFWQGELIGRKKDGDTFPKWLTISVCRNDEGDIVNYIGSFFDISARKEAQERINFLAHHDALTGLINRFSLEERLAQSINASRRNKRLIGLMFLDMDRFKTINDTLGHQAGDELLVEVAARLKNSVRESDIVARIGGDEFVIVMTDVEESIQLAYLARFIVHILGVPYRIQNREIYSSPSVGISVYPEDGEDVETLMKNADSAMYHAKELGRNNYQFFTESLNKNANERLKLENDLRQAIEAQSLELYYQPQIAAKSGVICGVEALLRWQHPEHGFIAPDKFISIAEESKLIIPLGEWVLTEACRQLYEWRNNYATEIKMAINISAWQLQSASLVDKLKQLIQEYQFKSGELELEVTESTAMEDPESAISKLCEIRALGIELAIDDFGTGYSSLSYLKLLPIHTLKLDRTFVKDLESNLSDAEISAGAIALAHNLGLKVVAEGVETEPQKDFLIRHQCDILQGYYFAKPLPARELEKWLSG